MTAAPFLQLAVAVTTRECADAVCATTPWKTTAAAPVRNSNVVRLKVEKRFVFIQCPPRTFLSRDFQFDSRRPQSYTKPACARPVRTANVKLLVKIEPTSTLLLFPRLRFRPCGR